MDFPVVILKLDEVDSLDDAAKRLFEGAKLDVRPEKVEWPRNDVLRRRWILENETMGVNEVTSGTDETFKYIFVNALVERAKTVVKDSNNEFLDRDDRINKVSTDVLFFENNNSVFAAVFMNLTKSTMYKLNYILKDLLLEEYWGTHTISPPDYHISDSVYYWLLSKFIIGDRIIHDNPKMTIETFTGYSGTVVDDAHVMSGEGERVSALLGTLAFIFGDDSLKSLKLHVCVNDSDNVMFELSHTGNVQIIEDEYDGDFCTGTQTQEKILLTFLVYKKIIPQMLEAFKKAKDSNEWNEDIKRDFIRKVGDSIITRVQEELKKQDELQKKFENRE